MKSVFITGSNRGLGRSLKETFMARGWRVFAGERGVEASGASHDANATGGRGELFHIELDVRDASSIARAARRIAGHGPGGLDVLINNAAVNPAPDLSAALGELDFDAIQHTYDVNAVGPLRVIQGLLPLLERGSRKLIVNVSSEAGSLQHSWRDRMYGYCMSKAALNMQTTIVDRALRPRGFNVLAVHPGWMKTDMGGPNAALDPAESAEGIYQIVEAASAATPRFLQHDGTPFPW